MHIKKEAWAGLQIPLQQQQQRQVPGSFHPGPRPCALRNPSNRSVTLANCDFWQLMTFVGYGQEFPHTHQYTHQQLQ